MEDVSNVECIMVIEKVDMAMTWHGFKFIFLTSMGIDICISKLNSV